MGMVYVVLPAFPGAGKAAMYFRISSFCSASCFLNEGSVAACISLKPSKPQKPVCALQVREIKRTISKPIFFMATGDLFQYQMPENKNGCIQKKQGLLPGPCFRLFTGVFLGRLR